MHVLRWLAWTGNRFDTEVPKVHQSVFVDAPTKALHTSPLENYAAWLSSPQAQLSVSAAPFPKCDSDELVLNNYVAAVNPVDWKIQTTGGIGFDLKYPLILGEDVAGEVLEVGSNLMDKFKVGDRVMAHALGLGSGSPYGGFQLYPILTAATTSKIPDDISFRDAAVLPLSISTAAAGLFMNDSLGLEYPSIAKSVTYYENGSTLLVWGCSSSVGSSVIQLAKAAGYQVITTASPSNYKYCRGLGADRVLDYHDKQIVCQLIELLKGSTIVGAYDAIGSDLTVHQSAAVLHALGGGKIVSVGLAPEIFSDVTISGISSGEIVSKEPEVAAEIWGKYVPWALKSGKLVPSPKALVVGEGLESVQKGLDRQKDGVSARKVEVVLR